MGRSCGFLTVCVATVIAAGCGSSSTGTNAGSDTGSTPNPLIGVWTSTILPQTGVSYALTLTFATGGGLTLGLGTTPSCSGTLSYTGYGWTSTATTVAITGTGACTGAGFTCTNGATCATTPLSATSCTFALSNSNNTLVLTCPAPNDSLNLTYTRGT